MTVSGRVIEEAPWRGGGPPISFNSRLMSASRSIAVVKRRFLKMWDSNEQNRYFLKIWDINEFCYFAIGI